MSGIESQNDNNQERNGFKVQTNHRGEINKKYQLNKQKDSSRKTS